MSSYVNIIGLDVSLTGTGICGVSDNGHIAFTSCIVSKPSKSPMERYTIIYNKLAQLYPFSDKTTVFLEGYAFNAKGSVFDIAECTGIIKHSLWKAGTKTVIVPPTTLKKFTTGKGVAPKDVMIKEVFKHYKFDTNNNNIADAVALAMLGYAVKALPLSSLPKYKQDALATLQLPL